MNTNLQSEFKKSILNGSFLFLILLVLNFSLSLIFQLIFLQVFEDGNIYAYALCSLAPILALFIVIKLYFKTTNQKFLTSLNVKKINPIFILASLLLAVGMFLGLGFLNSLIQDWLVGIGLKPSGAFNFTITSPLELIVMIIVLAVLPGFFEEMFFRNVLVKSLDGVKSAGAILVLALTFALYHCSVYQFVYQFIYGLTLVFLAVQSKSALPGILAHTLNNVAILVLEYLKISLDLFNPIIISIGATCLVLFIVITFLSVKKKDAEKNNGNVAVKNYLLPYGVVAFAVCTFIAILSVV